MKRRDRLAIDHPSEGSRGGLLSARSAIIRSVSRIVTSGQDARGRVLSFAFDWTHPTPEEVASGDPRVSFA